MQKNLEKKVLAYCDKYQMFQQGDSVVLGVSGGADSVCLFFVLLALREKWTLKLHVVHVNHGIRKEAGEDAEYVRGLCEAYRVPYYLVERNIPVLAAEWGCSEEEAGRKVRYEAFERVLEEQQASKIAVAHNANDRAETMLFHLFRGTGLTGLGSIRPVRDQIVRPLLCVEREEIESYLAEKQVMYRHDCTNDSDDYTRNKIRHHILNYAQEEIVSGCVGNMTRTADILAETENYIEEQVNAAIKDCVVWVSQEPDRHWDATEAPDWHEDIAESPAIKEKSYEVDCEKYLKLHSVIQKRLLLQLLKELSPMHKDITATHVEDIHSLFVQEGNRSIHLPYGIRGNRQYDKVILEKESQVPTGKAWEPVTIYLSSLGEEEVTLTVGRGKKFLLQVISVEKSGINCKDIPQNQYTKWFDYDKIKECLVFRTRKSGDYLCIKGTEGMQHKKLKDYMIAEKIPKKRRDELPLVAVDNHILWLVGYRISEYYKVEENTKNILQVCFKQSNRRQ